jgi:hypothetical protein
MHLIKDSTKKVNKQKLNEDANFLKVGIFVYYKNKIFTKPSPLFHSIFS